MIKKSFAVILSLFLFALTLSMSNGNDDEVKNQYIRSPLVAYGEMIYKREDCGKCHTLEVEKETVESKSLDGVGGRYSNDWLYFYLRHPESLFPHSGKKPYKKLYDRPLDKEVLQQIFGESEVDSLWEEMLVAVDTFAKLQMLDLETKAKQTEIFALIAYIQQIPSSREKARRDSVKHQEWLKLEMMWDSILASETMGSILTKADDESYIERGQTVFEVNCAVCHGKGGGGMVGPNLTDEYWLHGGEKSDIARVIINGVNGKGMPSWKNSLSQQNIGALVAYISSIQGSNPPHQKFPQGEKMVINEEDE